MAFRCTKPTPHPVKTLAYEPWALTVKPFQVSPRTWYVAGQTWVGCYLIDTGSGLILIDTAIPESMYLLVDSIYRLGYKPEDIKKILLSHAHFDHCGACLLYTSKHVGLYTIIFLTNYQLIDRSMYEAATTDGANGWQTYAYITLPSLKPAFMLNAVYAIIQFLKTYTVSRILSLIHIFLAVYFIES